MWVGGREDGGEGGRCCCLDCKRNFAVDPTHEQVLIKVLKPKMVMCNENGREGEGRLFLFPI